MKNLRFLITAGPTREPIDPVRFISNRSSGKMGYALVQAALDLGHSVTLITGPVNLTPPDKSKTIKVETTDEMRNAVLKHSKKADIIIMAAAVADYRPKKIQHQKIKKTKSSFNLALEKNPDILKELGRIKSKKQFLVGFAAETQHLLKYAGKKLREKNLDLIAANIVGKKGKGFESDENQIVVIDNTLKSYRWPKMSKVNLGMKLIKFILSSDELRKKAVK
jgi:phosphopantothenoylcysteine decarboxylase/phosphopantothenate--cysteine ligase